ncbi:hypothetical protein NEFER03_1457 [Nematocida sp. LUAm3]|nr:hypothetical protein NEFER03_1457 [Nematocida sp. LUAm3]KAI5174713.1 hypothetical protein NEFER02_0823 [Nematocida sp. LUAm2]KAI5177876.1 hypothetical protein NEFER01_1078 [Nematocida sp. LUAm1]
MFKTQGAGLGTIRISGVLVLFLEIFFCAQEEFFAEKKQKAQSLYKSPCVLDLTSIPDCFTIQDIVKEKKEKKEIDRVVKRHSYLTRLKNIDFSWANIFIHIVKELIQEETSAKNIEEEEENRMQNLSSDKNQSSVLDREKLFSLLKRHITVLSSTYTDITSADIFSKEKPEKAEISLNELYGDSLFTFFLGTKHKDRVESIVKGIVYMHTPEEERKKGKVCIVTAEDYIDTLFVYAILRNKRPYKKDIMEKYKDLRPHYYEENQIDPNFIKSMEKEMGALSLEQRIKAAKYFECIFIMNSINPKPSSKVRKEAVGRCLKFSGYLEKKTLLTCKDSKKFLHLYSEMFYQLHPLVIDLKKIGCVPSKYIERVENGEEIYFLHKNNLWITEDVLANSPIRMDAIIEICNSTRCITIHLPFYSKNTSEQIVVIINDFLFNSNIEIIPKFSYEISDIQRKDFNQRVKEKMNSSHIEESEKETIFLMSIVSSVSAACIALYFLPSFFFIIGGPVVFFCLQMGRMYFLCQSTRKTYKVLLINIVSTVLCVLLFICAAFPRIGTHTQPTKVDRIIERFTIIEFFLIILLCGALFILHNILKICLFKKRIISNIIKNALYALGAILCAFPILVFLYSASIDGFILLKSHIMLSGMIVFFLGTVFEDNDKINFYDEKKNNRKLIFSIALVYIVFSFIISAMGFYSILKLQSTHIEVINNLYLSKLNEYF